MPSGTNTSAAAKGGDKWFYMEGGSKQGPVDGYTLASKIESGDLDQNAHVWKKGMSGWAPAASTDLMDNLNASRPAPVVDIGKGEKPAKKRKKRGWIWVIVVVLLLAAAAAAWWFFLRPEAEAPIGNKPEEPVVTYNFKEEVIFANDQCEFIIDDIGEKGDYLELDVRCVNKTNDVLAFRWNATSINGCMFDPIWDVTVRADTTVKSSITFPLTLLQELGMLPADELRFILQIYNQEELLRFEDAFRLDDGRRMALYVEDAANDYGWDRNKYKLVKGFEDYVFDRSVKLDKEGRPYFVMEDDSKEALAAIAAAEAEGKKPEPQELTIYFDELYDMDGNAMFPVSSEEWDYDVGFYEDDLGRPYYFNEYGSPVYFEGYGFAFHDEETGKNYFYDENGSAVYYGNGGRAEVYEGKPSKEVLEAGMPDIIEKSASFNIVHRDYVIYPTGKTADEIVYPERAKGSNEEVFWEGEKGTFIIRGGGLDSFRGYVVNNCVENNSENYIYFSWEDVGVNGIYMGSGGYSVIRPNSRAYWNVTIPKTFMDENKIKLVQEIDFRVFAVGEELQVPLYPILWETPVIK